MNAQRLIEIAMDDDPLETAEFNAACIARGIDLHNLCDEISKQIAEGYLQGHISWDVGDLAMNLLFSWAYGNESFGLSCFSMDIYLAFDQAEWHHDQPPESGPEFHTVPRLKKALDAQMAQLYAPADALRRG